MSGTWPDGRELHRSAIERELNRVYEIIGWGRAPMPSRTPLPTVAQYIRVADRVPLTVTRPAWPLPVAIAPTVYDCAFCGRSRRDEKRPCEGCKAMEAVGR